VRGASSRAGASAAAAIAHALSTEVRRLRRHDAGLRAADPRAVHQSRVAVRRLRSHLRVFRPLIDGDWSATTFDGLRPLARTLGTARDLDVAAARVTADGADLRPIIDPLLDDLAAKRRDALAGVLACLDDEGYPAFVSRIAEGARRPRLRLEADGAAADVLAPLARRAWRALERGGDALTEDSDDAAFHAVRIRAKRARYALEALPGRDDAVGELAARVADVQTVLGELQDGVLTREQILLAAARRASDGPFGLAAGVLLERQDERMRESRAAYAVAWRILRRRRLSRHLQGRCS
jgi:CHAD domain-containing protein